MALAIRNITKDDNKAIAALIRRVFVEFKIDKPGTVYTDPTTDNLYDLFQHENAIYFIAELDNKMVGGCGIFPTKGLPNGYAELVKFYIAKEYRGKGIGYELMQKSLDWATNTGYSHLYLESFPELEKAVSLYKKIGFKYIAHPLGDSGHFACTLWMHKEL